jgi:hypothetical protein
VCASQGSEAGWLAGDRDDSIDIRQRVYLPFLV